jgi:aromatic amino acid aminotransferase I / 2-aminoadipate transaminase
VVQEWGWEGWKTWLRGLAGQYEMRRNWICEGLVKEFGLADDGEEEEVIECKGDEEVEGDWLAVKKGRVLKVRDLVAFQPPTAGMFVWLKVNVQLHPRYKSLYLGNEKMDNLIELMDELWEKIAIEGGLIIIPGRYFTADVKTQGENIFRPSCIALTSQFLIYLAKAQFFRISFSMSEEAELKLCAKKLKEVTVNFFRE